MYVRPSKNIRISEGVDLIEGEKRIKGEHFKRDNRISLQEYKQQSEVREKELNSIDTQSNADSNFKFDPNEDLYSQFIKFARIQAYKHTHSISGKHPLSSLKQRQMINDPSSSSLNPGRRSVDLSLVGRQAPYSSLSAASI